jgi:hypothetical protein
LNFLIDRLVFFNNFRLWLFFDLNIYDSFISELDTVTFRAVSKSKQSNIVSSFFWVLELDRNLNLGP